MASQTGPDIVSGSTTRRAAADDAAAVVRVSVDVDGIVQGVGFRPFRLRAG
ncbi:hypothetical protein [Pseudofrankia sp. DC12]|uniref:hypothetical protein n=1 Tax=Pseudofrankia sp. DC12 TaxID=683315 RepID=UPI000AD84BA9|nr:hypothetical protein [Pseudofrankia sp. DC12]